MPLLLLLLPWNFFPSAGQAPTAPPAPQRGSVDAGARSPSALHSTKIFTITRDRCAALARVWQPRSHEPGRLPGQGRCDVDTVFSRNRAAAAAGIFSMGLAGWLRVSYGLSSVVGSPGLRGKHAFGGLGSAWTGTVIPSRQSPLLPR